MTNCPNCNHDGKPIGNMGLIACENVTCRVAVFYCGYSIPMKTDKDFLLWISDRLIKVHGEHPGQDFILRLQAIASKL